MVTKIKLGDGRVDGDEYLLSYEIAIEDSMISDANGVHGRLAFIPADVEDRKDYLAKLLDIGEIEFVEEF